MQAENFGYENEDFRFPAPSPLTEWQAELLRRERESSCILEKAGKSRQPKGEIEMKRKILIACGVATAMLASSAFAATASSDRKSTASAVLDQGGNEIEVTVELDGNRSVEFAKGAVYLYDGEIEDGNLLAMGITLNRNVYEEYLDRGMNMKDFQKEGLSTRYVEEDGTYVTLFEDRNAAFMITSEDPEASNLFEMKTEKSSKEETASSLFSEEELNAAQSEILMQILEWDDCELHDLRYAGDEFSTGAELERINDGEEKYVATARFLMDFRSPKKVEKTTFEPDTEYTDYNWILGLTADGSWEIVDCGY